MKNTLQRISIDIDFKQRQEYFCGRKPRRGVTSSPFLIFKEILRKKHKKSIRKKKKIPILN